MGEHKYILQPYRGKASRHTCPACEHKNEFTLYVEVSNNQPLHFSVGKCNRESKCGYHYTPADYFKDNPNGNQLNDWKPTYQPQHAKEERIVYLPQKFIPDGSGLIDNNLFRFFESKFGKDRANEVFRLYRVGTSKHWKNGDGLSAAFPQIDSDDRLRQIKVIAYNPATGKRLHKEHPAGRFTPKGYVADTEQDKVWFAGKTLLNDYEANLKQCFFGEHLIRTGERIAIVESEKTAMIASLYLPDFVWIATGGKNGCKWTETGVFKTLIGKSIFLYPDLKCCQEWTEKAQKLISYGLNVTVSKYLEDIATDQDKNSGLDIADFLLKEPLPENNIPVPHFSGAVDNQVIPQKDCQNLRKLQIENKKSTVLNTIGELLEYAHQIAVSDRIKINLKRNRI